MHKYIRSNLLPVRRQLRAHAGGDAEAHSCELVREHRYSTNAPWCECLSINPEGSLGNVECGKTNRSVLNQNGREQLPDTKLIPYLGLHKKSINTWKECNQKHNARERKKKISLCKTKRSTAESAAPAVSLLITSKLDQKARRWDRRACVGV